MPDLKGRRRGSAPAVVRSALGTTSPAGRVRGALGIVGVLIGCLLFAGCGGMSGLDGTGDKGYLDGKGVLTRLPEKEWKRPGDVAGTTLEGKQVSLADLRGQVVVVNVWGSWCPPCRAEASMFAAVARELEPKGVRFLGVNVRDNGKEAGLAYQRRFGIDFPSIYDPSGKTLLAFHAGLNPSTIPTTLIIDKQGRVRARVLGPISSRNTLIGLTEDAAK